MEKRELWFSQPIEPHVWVRVQLYSWLICCFLRCTVKKIVAEMGMAWKVKVECFYGENFYEGSRRQSSIEKNSQIERFNNFDS